MNKVEEEAISFFKRRRTFSITSIIVLFLVITNPSLKAFKEHIGALTDNGDKTNQRFSIIRRNSNYFLFSFYEYEDSTTDRDYYYLAIAGNFYPV